MFTKLHFHNVLRYEDNCDLPCKFHQHKTDLLRGDKQHCRRQNKKIKK